jgi:ectoine hydroxylase-related dioxygenase (phytanoyl-CoA dioxygenase family)
MSPAVHPISGQLAQQGFAIIPAVLPPETVDKLVEEIDDALKARASHSDHAMRHLIEVVPAVRKVAEEATIRALVKTVLGPSAFVVRSIFFDKTPDANWKVAWHQDLTIAVRQKIEVAGFTAWSVKDGVAHVQPPVEVLEQMLALRLHLDDCGPANGPLQVIPGSHKSGRLNARQISEWRDRQPAEICSVSRGGALLMRPLLLHASSPATEPKHRRVLHLEFAAGPLPCGLQWL